jgi:hypothetical protein
MTSPTWPSPVAIGKGIERPGDRLHPEAIDQGLQLQLLHLGLLVAAKARLDRNWTPLLNGRRSPIALDFCYFRL